MEQKLFTWTGFDVLDTNCMQFYNCKLVVAFDNFAIGEGFDIIILDHEQGIMILRRNGVEYIYQLSYRIGARIGE